MVTNYRETDLFLTQEIYSLVYSALISVAFNPLHTGGLFHCYMYDYGIWLGKVVLVFAGRIMNYLFFTCIILTETVNANSTCITA